MGSLKEKNKKKKKSLRAALTLSALTAPGVAQVWLKF